MLDLIQLYLEQDQQDAAMCREQSYTQWTNAIDRTSQQDCQRMEEEEAILALLALGYLGTPGSRTIHTYLTRANIPTMTDTAWACLWGTQNERAFITTMGVDVSTFEDLLARFADRWNFNTIS